PLSLCLYYFVLLHSSAPPFSTLSLHDALPIFPVARRVLLRAVFQHLGDVLPPFRENRNDIFHSVEEQLVVILPFIYPAPEPDQVDRKSTRLNSSHVKISYAVFCLKKKKRTRI